MGGRCLTAIFVAMPVRPQLSGRPVSKATKRSCPRAISEVLPGMAEAFNLLGHQSSSWFPTA